jgi:hypothetical protein
VGNDLTGLPPAARAPGTEDAAHAVTALYREHALGLTRLAFNRLNVTTGQVAGGTWG